MTIPELQKQIVSGDIDHIHIFTGEEVGIMDIYLRQVCTKLNVELAVLNTVQEAHAKMTQRRMTGKPKCYLVIDDKDFLKEEKMWAKVFADAAKSSDTLIIRYTTMDKRSKFYKHYEKELTEFSKLSPEVLVKYIQKELPGVSPKECAQMAEVCECDYSRILLECDKIRQYSRGLNEPCDTASVDFGLCFLDLLKKGVIHQPIGDITFKLTDAILLRNIKETATYLQQARLKQEPEIMVLSILYNGFKHILMVQGLGRDQSEPVKRTGLTPWQVKMAKEKQGRYTLEELVHALETVRFAEQGIKTGQLDADVSLEYVIVNVM